jgi:DNA-directed RNA polymerase subunit RPC12/RpoP
MSSKTSELPETRDIVCPYCKGSLTVSANCMSIPCSHCNQHINIRAIDSQPEEKKKSSSQTRDIVCPYCKGNLTVSANCMSMPCSHCNQHINIKAVLLPSAEGKEKSSVERRRLHCFKCEREIFADEKAFAVICKYCSRRNDLSDYTVKSRLGRNLETHGTLYLKKKGKIEIPNVQVGNAIIQGIIKGNLKAVGTVEVLKSGEIYGKITCRKLIVNKGAIFDGSVEMLDAELKYP